MRLRTLMVIALFTLSAAVGTVQANHSEYGSHDRCDTDYDGTVSDSEQQECDRQDEDNQSCHSGCEGGDSTDNSSGGGDDSCEGNCDDMCQTGCDGGPGDCSTGCEGQESGNDDQCTTGCDGQEEDGLAEKCDDNGNGVADDGEWYDQGCGTWGQDDSKPCDFNRDGEESHEELNDRDCDGSRVETDPEKIEAKCDDNGNGVADEGEWYDEGCGTWGQDDENPCDFDRDGHVSQRELDDADCGAGDHDVYEARGQVREDAIAQAESEGRVAGKFEVEEEGQADFETEEGVRVSILAGQHQGEEDLQAYDLRITLDAELSSGRTFVFAVDSDVFDGTTFTVAHFILDEESAEEIEASIGEATSLEDILDPNDDEGAAEFWIVTDANGVHVLISIGGWSVHSIAINGEKSPGSAAIPGVSMFVVVVALACTLIWTQRKQD